MQDLIQLAIPAFLLLLLAEALGPPLRDLSHWLRRAWSLAFFADDLSYYRFHRTSHGVPLLQGFACRPSLVVTRQSWYSATADMNRQLCVFHFRAWMSRAGFTPVMVLRMQSILPAYRFRVHAVAIGRGRPGAGPQHLHAIGYITPRIRNTIDRNPAGALILRHRRFGTFEPEAGRCTYGLTKNIENLCSFGNPGWKRSPAQARPRQREAGA